MNLLSLVENDIRRTLRTATDAAVNDRLKEVIKANRRADPVRAIRCLELLERMNTKEARAIVMSQLYGDPDDLLTRDARDTLTRMEQARSK